MTPPTEPHGPTGPEAEPVEPAERPARRRFGPERIAVLPVVVLLLGSLPLAASSSWLTWIVLVPVVCAVWVLRARVVLAPVGVAVCNGLGTTRLPWSDVEGFDVPRRGPVRLVRLTGRPLLLTALPRHQLPQLTTSARRLSAVDPAHEPGA